MPQLQVHQRDHYERKISRKIEPMIEEQDLLLRAKITELTETSYPKLVKKLGVDKIISDLDNAEVSLENARRSVF